MSIDVSRRGFLKILGIGGAGAAAASGGLFSMGLPLVGRADHFVFDYGVARPLLAPRSCAHFLYKAEEKWLEAHPPNHSYTPSSVSRILLRGPQSFFPAKPWSPVGTLYDYTVEPPEMREGEDPHVAFFMAAADLQRQIDSDVQDFAKALSERSLTMVTMADTPIMAYPKPDGGYSLGVQISQFAVEASDLVNRDQVVSEKGDVPIDVPNHITFKYLLMMEEELKQAGMLPHQRDRGVYTRAFSKVRGRA